MSRAARPDVVIAAHAIQALTLKALLPDEVATITGMTPRTAARHISALHEHRMVHVAEWGPDSRGYLTIRKYRWGNLPDVPRPAPPTTSTDRVRAMRERQKATS